MTPRQSRISRISRQSSANQPVSTLEHDGVAIALQEALGTRVLLIRVIGEGGMGRVYLGRDPQLKRFVAVKVLVSAGSDVEAHARFQREAQAIAAVSHPNVVSIYGVGELPDGTPYFVMEYVSGGSMSERLAATGQLDIEMAETVIGDVAAALAAAHKRGIVHRDVKPANVLWDEESERATVSDFGIASLMSESEDENEIRITQGGMTLGSPAYMSPEQLLAEPITPKSDIYALGLLGYELLTGRGPYTAETPAAVAAAHLRDEPRRLSESRPDVPPVLDALLTRCLAKTASERPNAEEVMAALRPGAAEILEWPPPGLERARGVLWRMMVMPALVAACLLLPLLLMLRVPEAWLENTIVWPIVLAVALLLGVSALVGAAFPAWRVARVFGTAARLGYGWGTLFEAISDRRGDTGALIAGTREYAILSPRERSLFRLLRVARALLLLIAAPTALIVALLALGVAGGEQTGPASLMSMVTMTLVLLVAAGLVVAVPEFVRLANTRRRRGDPTKRKSDAELAPAWYAAFERAREGQLIGGGADVRRSLATVFGVGAVLAVLSAAGVLLLITFLTFFAQTISTTALTPLTNRLIQTASHSAAGRSYRTPPDGVTTPAEAGEAIVNLTSTSRARQSSPLERRASRDFPHWNRVTPPVGLFAKWAGRDWTDAAILAAATGLSAAQRTLLERAAAHPARDEFARVARATEADVYGAILKLPLTAPLHPSEYPNQVVAGIDAAMESRAARVALDVADHKLAAAEQGARDMIAVASVVMDMPFTVNVLAGHSLLQRGIRTLESVYIASGRERDARILQDSVASSSRATTWLSSMPPAYQLRRMMHDHKLARGIRIEILVPLLTQACADPRQLLFGIDEATRKDVAYARDSLARFPSERVWTESMEQMMDGALAPPPASANEYSLHIATIPRIVDGIVGGYRFENCVTYSPVFAQRY